MALTKKRFSLPDDDCRKYQPPCIRYKGIKLDNLYVRNLHNTQKLMCAGFKILAFEANKEEQTSLKRTLNFWSFPLKGWQKIVVKKIENLVFKNKRTIYIEFQFINTANEEIGLSIFYMYNNLTTTSPTACAFKKVTLSKFIGLISTAVCKFLYNFVRHHHMLMHLLMLLLLLSVMICIVKNSSSVIAMMIMIIIIWYIIKMIFIVIVRIVRRRR